MSRFPAARITDPHACPIHGGGPIASGFPTVLVGKLPAARIGDIGLCLGFIPDPIVYGSPTVLIGKSPASRQTDACAHGGVIAMGLPTVLIGIIGGGARELAMSAAPTAADACLKSAAKGGSPFVAA